jgi:hypothetical protein
MIAGAVMLGGAILYWIVRGAKSLFDWARKPKPEPGTAEEQARLVAGGSPRSEDKEKSKKYEQFADQVAATVPPKGKAADKDKQGAEKPACDVKKRVTLAVDIPAPKKEPAIAQAAAAMAIGHTPDGERLWRLLALLCGISNARNLRQAGGPAQGDR